MELKLGDERRWKRMEEVKEMELKCSIYGGRNSLGREVEFCKLSQKAKVLIGWMLSGGE